MCSTCATAKRNNDSLCHEAGLSLRRLWIWMAMCALVGCSEESPAGPNPDFVRTDIILVVPRVCYQYIGGGQLPCSVEPYTMPWEGTVGCWQS